MTALYTPDFEAWYVALHDHNGVLYRRVIQQAEQLSLDCRHTMSQAAQCEFSHVRVACMAAGLHPRANLPRKSISLEDPS